MQLGANLEFRLDSVGLSSKLDLSLDVSQIIYS